MQTVTIPKKEYDRLKQIEAETDVQEFAARLDRGIADAKEGNVVKYWVVSGYLAADFFALLAHRSSPAGSF